MELKDYTITEIISYIQNELMKFTDRPLTSINTEAIKNYINSKVIGLSTHEREHFSYDIKGDPSTGNVNITPHNLFTGVFLQEGIIIPVNATEWKTMYGTYTFDNGLQFTHNMPLEYVKFETTIEVPNE